MPIKLKSGMWKVGSRSKAGETHLVMTHSVTGLLICSCPAGQHNRPCHHTAEVANEIKAEQARLACGCFGCRTESKYGCCRLAATDSGYMSAVISAQLFELGI